MAHSFRNLNILLVEDDKYMRFLVRDILKVFGVGEIKTARDGTAAYQELKNFPADIVIIGWVMRLMNGLEFLEKLRNAIDSPNPYVPTIMLTAFTEIERVKESRDMGITVSRQALYAAEAVQPDRVGHRGSARICKFTDLFWARSPARRPPFPGTGSARECRIR